MTPQTVRRIAQEIRHQRALLTAEEEWAQRQPATETRSEVFRRVFFWRRVYAHAEQELSRQTVDEPMAATG